MDVDEIDGLSQFASPSTALIREQDGFTMGDLTQIGIDPTGTISGSFTNGETIVLAQLHGETDTSGYPEYDAIMGGVVSHWDEQTGDMIVRGITAWGGKGVRGDTDHNASRLLGALFTNISGSKDAIGLVAPGLPMPKGGPGGLVCGHCGFAAAHERAFYCPKCGMRMVRG